jgi:uncharacterized membrane protein YgcG
MALGAVALAGFIACSDSKTGESESVATTQAALSGGTDPVVRYAFNETSGALASDSSGNGHAATLVNGAAFVTGTRGNAVRINGGSQRVDLPPGVVQRCDDLTIAARVNLASNTANWARIFDFGASTTSYMFLTPRAGAANILRFGITTSGGTGEQQISHTFTFPTNAWKHVAVVLNGNTGTLYVDGAQVAQNTNLTLNPSALGATANNWLGDSQFASDPTLNGSLDDVVVSCRPYSAAEIAWLANGSDPVAQYTFNETSGTTAADSSGNARNATLANGASFAAGLHGNAVQIAGGSQRVNLPTGIVQSCTDLTIAAHVRLTTNSANWARIFDIGASTSSYLMLTPRAGAANILRFAITTGGTAAEQRLSHTFTFPTNTWKHVAVTLSGNTGTMYLDGVQVAQNTSMTLNPNALGATANNWLGDSQFTADPTLNGSVDNLFISCRALSPSEIGNLAGACSSAANCNDNNPCTADTCNSGFCSRTRLADGTACANATVCDGAETCQNGWCAAGTPPVVDDGNVCTTDTCDPVQGVTHTPISGCGSGGSGGAGGSSGAGGSGATSGTGGTSGGGVTCSSGTTPVEMFIELPPGVARNTIALGSYGTPLDIHDRVRVLASTTTFASVSSLAGGPNPTRLGVEAHVQNFWAEPSLELRDRSRVHGDAVSPGAVTLLSGAIVDGQTLQQTLTPRRRESWLVCHPNTHQGNVDVQPGQTFPSASTRLNPGAWGTLSVKTGGRLRLNGNTTYFFESIAIEPGGILNLDTAAGGTQLYFRNGGFFRGSQERTDARSNVLFGAEAGNFVIGSSFRGTVAASSIFQPSPAASIAAPSSAPSSSRTRRWTSRTSPWTRRGCARRGCVVGYVHVGAAAHARTTQNAARAPCAGRTTAAVSVRHAPSAGVGPRSAWTASIQQRASAVPPTVRAGPSAVAESLATRTSPKTIALPAKSVFETSGARSVSIRWAFCHAMPAGPVEGCVLRPIQRCAETTPSSADETASARPIARTPPRRIQATASAASARACVPSVSRGVASKTSSAQAEARA